MQQGTYYPLHNTGRHTEAHWPSPPALLGQHAEKLALAFPGQSGPEGQGRTMGGQNHGEEGEREAGFGPTVMPDTNLAF